MKAFLRVLALALLVVPAAANAAAPYWVRIFDAATGRGVPLVKVVTPGGAVWTDSGGVVVLDDARLQGRDVVVRISSPGYRFEEQVDGQPGAVLRIVAGRHDELKITRENVAERLYRVTGANIYGQSVRAGLAPPIAHPLINSGVIGQDTNIAEVYDGKIFWCWGDTDGPPRDDGKKRFNGKVTCATSLLPGRGGLDPSVGVDFAYFARSDGFVRGMVPIKRKGLVWIEGLFTATDPEGRQRLLATYTRQLGQQKPVESGIVAYDDTAEVFRIVAEFPIRPRHTSSHPFRARLGGVDYLYTFPVQRVPDRWDAIMDPQAWESWTCMTPGVKLDMDDPALERDADGALVCGWKQNAEWLTADRERQLVDRGLIDVAHAGFPLIDTDTGKPTGARADSVTWNAYRGKWILLSKNNHTVYYSEADRPEGPWVRAVPIVRHAPWRLYNVVQHPFFDADGGRVIYFEGTFTHKLSATDAVVPDYEYNNIMYRIDLSDPRLAPARVE